MSKLRTLSRILSDYPHFDIFGRCLVLGYRGSVVHGTFVSSNTIEDDKDVMGVCIPPAEYYLGLKKFEQFERLPEKEDRRDPWDIIIYEFHKYIRLLLKSNPNVLSLMWLSDKYIIHSKPAWNLLVENRGLFVSKKAYHSFSGYAYGQLKRMTAMSTHWKMGAKRKALVEKFGYDTKNAAHLVRLLRMGIEFLNEGALYPIRKDASQLIQIKQGQWSLSKVQREADRLFKVCEQAYLKSTLPNEPDYDGAKQLAFEITRDFLSVGEDE